MLISVCLLVDLIFRFCYNYLTCKTGGADLAWTIILVAQATRLTKCANCPKNMLLQKQFITKTCCHPENMLLNKYVINIIAQTFSH